MYSFDFISIVLKAYNNRTTLNMTVVQIATFYEVSKQSIYNWIGCNYNLNKNNKRIYIRKNSEYDKKYIKYVLSYVNKNPQFIMKNLLQQLNLLFGINVCKNTIYMILKKNNITRKIVQINKYPHSTDKYLTDLKRLQKEIKNRKKRIISIDETAINIDNIGNYGWSDRGKRCIINKKHRNKGVRFSLLFGISRSKIIGYAIKEGSFKGPDFSEYMNKINNKYTRYKYLLDNAVIHRARIINNDIRKKFIYNVPYSPQFNPIEYVNNELKRQIKIANIKNKNELIIFMDKFVKQTNKKGLKKYFEKSYNLIGV